MLARVLGLVGSAAPKPADGAITLVPPSDARRRLRELQRGLAMAEAALIDAQSATERARAVVREAEDAEEALTLAERAAQEASATWAAGGAVGDLPPAAQRLLEAADRARTRAYQAKLKAKGAETVLAQNQFDSRNRGAILSTEREALMARDQAREAVGVAVREVLQIEVITPALQRAGALHRELEAELNHLLPVWQVLRMSTNVHKFAGGSADLHDALAKLSRFKEPSTQLYSNNTVTRPPEQRRLQDAIDRFGTSLMTDADAEYEP